LGSCSIVLVSPQLGRVWDILGVSGAVREVVHQTGIEVGFWNREVGQSLAQEAQQLTPGQSCAKNLPTPSIQSVLRMWNRCRSSL
jgi:hypothetical protein